jgi:HD-GYP domain-containing protein (c-di-GMP phosphodiesterase class II)
VLLGWSGARAGGNVSESNISRDTSSRLASYVEERRRELVSAIVRSSVLPRPGSIGASVFAGSFLDRLREELETADSVLDAWVDAGDDPADAFEHARIVVIACAVVSAGFIAECGPSDDAISYLALRSSELEKRFRAENAVPAIGTGTDPAHLVSRDEVIASLLSAIEARDAATCEHSRAVGMWCGRIAKTLGMSAEQQAFAALAGTLHDVGKIATPTEILLKPGPLNDVEWEAMRAHARIGGKMLERIPSLKALAPIVRAHHERIDGRGYPDAIAGSAIPLLARIVAVADSFHAMISKRPYRDALPVSAALDELRAGAGMQWDAAVCDAMLDIVQPISVRRTLRVARGG